MMTVALIGLALASLAAIVFLQNVNAFAALGKTNLAGDADVSVSVLIPARDEESGILASVQAALASEGVDVEVIVLDDHSTDQTSALVHALADRLNQDSPKPGVARVRCHASPDLPSGWNGKQHACFQLAQLATHSRLLFIDADVRLAPDAIARLVTYQDAGGAALLSAFPRQETGTWLEKWLIPLMHYVLLCYLPFNRMRRSTSPGFASGCGQLFLTRQSDYQTAGTHQAIAASRHDGIKLPRLFRQSGLSTDVVDGSEIATCRMYHNAGQVVRGVLKNASEGIANVRLIVPFTVLLIGGSVIPIATAVVAMMTGRMDVLAVSAAGIALGHLPRFLAAIRFRQSFVGVVFHGPAVVLFVTLQWIALVQSLVGYQITWRGRV